MSALPFAELLYAVRLIHIVAGVGWLGEVAVINFVLVPVLLNARPEERVTLLALVFPRLFRLATILGGLAVGSGVISVLWYTQLQFDLLIASRWGSVITAGGALGTLLYGFHLFQESRAERSLASNLRAAIKSGDTPTTTRLLRRLATFPRVGMALLLIAVSLMVAAAHLS
ncbi:MAG: hypothetical protein HY331_18935 [Chloroflexi bacterium]|nr:hypothetical protein [Chloroflexota bacterium]